MMMISHAGTYGFKWIVMDSALTHQAVSVLGPRCALSVRVKIQKSSALEAWHRFLAASLSEAIGIIIGFIGIR